MIVFVIFCMNAYEFFCILLTLNVCVNKIHLCAKYLWAVNAESTWNSCKSVQISTTFYDPATIFCQFLKEQARCRLDKIISDFGKYWHASLKSWSESCGFHALAKNQKTFFSLDQIRAPFAYNFSSKCMLTYSHTLKDISI